MAADMKVKTRAERIFRPTPRSGFTGSGTARLVAELGAVMAKVTNPVEVRALG
jgi:hypothetical protein